MLSYFDFSKTGRKIKTIWKLSRAKLSLISVGVWPGPNWLFLGLGRGSNTVLGSTHVGEQLSFSILSSILTFYFCLIWGNFFSFWGTNGLFLGLG